MHTSVTLYFTLVFTINAQSPSFPDCKSGPLSTFPICNQSLPTRQRAADLINRLATSEKISRLGTSSAGIDRLGLPMYQWWSEALHGIAYSPGVSCSSHSKYYINVSPCI